MTSKNATCQKSARAFLACCHFMELLLGTHHNLVNGHMLDEAAENVRRSFQAAGWGQSCIKKFYWLLHYGDSLETHKTLVPCWAMERKHKQATSVATCVANLSHYEHSVFQELLSGQLHRLRMPLPQVPCFETMRAASKKAPMLRTTAHARKHVAKQFTAVTLSCYQLVAACLCEMSSW